MIDEPYILVLGSGSDIQVLSVMQALRGFGHQVLFIDSDSDDGFSIEMNSDAKILIHHGNKMWGTPTLVWTRLKIRTMLGHFDESTRAEFIRRSEWHGFLDELAHYFHDKQLYSIDRARYADRKMYHFGIAVAAGFRVPPTAYFLGKNHGSKFLKRESNVISKPIQARSVPAQKGNIDTFINLQIKTVDPNEFEKVDAEEFSVCPQLFQAQLKEGQEYRVIGFRNKSYVYRYKDRVESRVIPDERLLYGGTHKGHSVYAAQFEHIATPDNIATTVSSYLEKIGLEYGAFDIIQTKDDTLWLLECNHEGQWCAATCTHTFGEVKNYFASVISKEFLKRQNASTNFGKRYA